MPKPLTVWITTNCGKFLKRWAYQTTWPASWETCMQVRKQQLEMDMDEQAGSKSGKEYVKAVYCHPAYLTSMQSTSWEMLGWRKHSWNQDRWEKYQTQICRWYHSNGRKQPKEPFDEGERGEWKSWLKTQNSDNEDHGIWSHHLMANRWGNNGSSAWVTEFIFLGSKITADGDCSHEIERCLLFWRKVMTNLDSILKSRTLLCQQRSILSRLWFSSSHVCIWELDCEESWVLKNWCFWTMALEKTLESPLDCKEIQPVHLKGDQSWVFIGRTDVEAESLILWPSNEKSWLIWNDPDAGKGWGKEEKGTTEDEMAGLHHWLNGHEFG